MMYRASLFLLLSAFVAAQRPNDRDDPLGRPDFRLPNGRLQRDEIVKADHKRNQEDAAKLALLAVEVRHELDAQDSFIVSLKMIKKVEDIDKLARSIRSRLKRN